MALGAITPQCRRFRRSRSSAGPTAAHGRQAARQCASERQPSCDRAACGADTEPAAHRRGQRVASRRPAVAPQPAPRGLGCVAPSSRMCCRTAGHRLCCRTAGHCSRLRAAPVPQRQGRRRRHEAPQLRQRLSSCRVTPRIGINSRGARCGSVHIGFTTTGTGRSVRPRVCSCICQHDSEGAAAAIVRRRESAPASLRASGTSAARAALPERAGVCLLVAEQKHDRPLERRLQQRVRQQH